MSSDPRKDIFKKFMYARIRTMLDYPDACNGETTLLKDISKAYLRWCLSEGYPRMDLKELEKYCNEYFGEAKGPRKYYSNILVFFNEEDVELFDEEHKHEYLEDEVYVLQKENERLKEENKKLKELMESHWTKVLVLQNAIQEFQQNNSFALKALLKATE